jgi:hypothetical protein
MYQQEHLHKDSRAVVAEPLVVVQVHLVAVVVVEVLAAQEVMQQH